MNIALYRRYRPEIFEEVIGQDHVIEPLMAALEAGRTTHAYLFSGPRGCGKTTSARILARCLNCVEYPTPTPCGECDSCRELARDGSGSLDVVELDAASHGGVDDARDLREQASFAPVRDRFKIFIIDEAHMVTTQGFNALLKLVEEPPAHVKFIFATTEPEKVIGTIRSRTHHYPFRLVPPPVLTQYLQEICNDENIEAPREVLSLVVRAGTGSVRDTLSVLDQIIGGSDGVSLDYERAVALLGYTSANLLDQAIFALANDDGPALFKVVDAIVTSGHDPRRFVEDLLQRLRDLVILALAGENAREVFVQVPEDQFAAMGEQAQLIGAKRASLAADFTNDALNKMAGATAPRLQLELLCARLLVQTVPVPSNAFPAVVAGAGAGAGASVAAVQASAGVGQIPAERGKTMPPETATQAAKNPLLAPMPSLTPQTPQAAQQASASGDGAGAGQMPPKAQNNRASQPPITTQMAHTPPAQKRDSHAANQLPHGNSPELANIAAHWAEILEIAAGKSRAVGAILEHSAGVANLAQNVLSIYFASPKWAAHFNQTIPALDIIARAVYAKTGLKTRVQGVVLPEDNLAPQRRQMPQADEGTPLPKAQAPAPLPELEQNPTTAESGADHGTRARAEQVAPLSTAPSTASAAAANEPAVAPNAVPNTAAAQSGNEFLAAADPVGVLRPLLDEVRRGAQKTEGATEENSAEDSGTNSNANSNANNGTAEETETTAATPAQEPFYRQVLPQIPPLNPPASFAPHASAKQATPAAQATPAKSDTPPHLPQHTSHVQEARVGAAFSSDAFTALAQKPTDQARAQNNAQTGTSAPLSAAISAHLDPQLSTKQDLTTDPFAALNAQEPPEMEYSDDWESVSVDDPTVAEADFVGLNVVLQELGGKVVQEIPRQK